MRHSGWLACYLFLAAVCVTNADQPKTVRHSVVEAGAVADGKTDNTAAFQKALDMAGQAGGGIVEVPSGRYRFNGTLSVPQGVTLQGTYRVPPTVRSKDQTPDGTVLLTYAGRGSEKGPPFLRLAGDNSAIAGLVVIYPEWKQSDVPPVPYPPCVQSENTSNVGILNCCFLNPYRAIKLIRAHRHLVRNVTGYPIRSGLYVDECYDIGHIENIHFWPFGVAYKHDDPFCKWVNTQGVAFELARTDWHYIANTFCFGYGVGYKFSQSVAGSTNGNFLGLGADSCRRAVLVEQAQAPGLLITNGEFVGRWGSTDSVCVEVGPKVEGKVSLVNCSFWGPIDRCVWMRAPDGQFTASACNFVHWDNNAKGSPAIELGAGKAIVQACTFGQSGTHVGIDQEIRSALLASNQATGGFHCNNRAGEKAQLLGNEVDPLESTPGAKSHYRLDVGALGDAGYLQQWHGRERRGSGDDARAVRWSMSTSQLILPVKIGASYRLKMTLEAPAQAVDSKSGLYVNGKKLSAITTNSTHLDVEIPPQDTRQISLVLRCRGWRPKEFNPEVNDDRTLGVSVFSVEMTADGASPRIFLVNNGAWLK